MRPPSPYIVNTRSALLALAMLAAAPTLAEDTPALPTCRPTVPVPPPEPPARPDGLIGGKPPGAPDPAVPLPPQRPPDLSASPPTEADPAAAKSGETTDTKIEPVPSQPRPTPLPPERPTGLPPAASPAPDAIPPLPSPDQPRCIPAQEAPLPPARPPELSPNPAALPDAPLPPERPPELSPSPPPTGDAPLPPARPPELSGDGSLKLTIAPQDDTACLRNLDDLGVAYAKAAPILNGQCTVANPLTVSRLGNGIVIGAPATMVCRLAEGLMRWTAQVQQVAETELGDTLKGLTLGGTYVCRGQNHGSEAQLSEHAFANAVDVMGFTFGKHAPILVGALTDGSKEAAFLAAVRTKACEHFTTVLSPGTDEQHANHLHLDERERKAGYRLCQ